MSNLQYAVSFAFAVVGVTAVFVIVRSIRGSRQEREKRKQVQSRIERDNVRRRESVMELDKLLSNKLAEVRPPSEGRETLTEAQKAIESVFYNWMNKYWDLFNLCHDSGIYITGIKNGQFVYDLPDNIKKYLKRNTA
jgi:predicted  nucleic acid-binding Zn-ribbon protein